MSNPTPMQTEAPSASSGKDESDVDKKAPKTDDMFSNKTKSDDDEKKDENSIESNPMMQTAKWIMNRDTGPDASDESGCESLPKSGSKESESPGAGVEQEVELEQVAKLAAGGM